MLPAASGNKLPATKAGGELGVTFLPLHSLPVWSSKERTMSITCSSCGKSFSFDLASTASNAVMELSEGIRGEKKPAPQKITYYPCCPHCKARHTVTK